MFKIKSNVPTPQAQRKGRGSKYPFDVMGVGDSFFVPLGEGQTAAHLTTRLKVAIFRWRNKHDLRQITFNVQEHADPDTCEPAVGVWRLT